MYIYIYISSAVQSDRYHPWIHVYIYTYIYIYVYIHIYIYIYIYISLISDPCQYIHVPSGDISVAHRCSSPGQVPRIPRRLSRCKLRIGSTCVKVVPLVAGPQRAMGTAQRLENIWAVGVKNLDVKHVMIHITGWWLSHPLWKIWVRQFGLLATQYMEK